MNVNQLGKPGPIQKSNEASVLRKAHYLLYYVRKGSILSSGIGVRKISYVECGLSPIKIHILLITRKV